MEPLSNERKQELEEQLVRMEHLRQKFYLMAVMIGVHGFIEFAGLMGDYINCCHDTLRAGQDFTECNVHGGVPLMMQDYQAAYLGEKFGCIYGPALNAEPALRDAFEQAWAYEVHAPVPVAA